MGALSDWWRWLAYGPADTITPPDPSLKERTVTQLTSMISDAIDARQGSFTLAEAMRLPAVVRGVQLLCSTAASFAPVAYRAGLALAEQPRIVRRPDPFTSRYDFVYASMFGLVTAGETFWRVLDRDSEGLVRSAIVLPGDEVRVEWDGRRFQRRYWWREQSMEAGREIVHIAIGRAPGELHGRGPLQAALPYLEVVKAAEDYASGFFESGGVPEVVLKASTTLTKEEAQAAKAQWIASRTGPEPAVFGKDIEAMFPSVDPQRAQMQEARAYGATLVARLLGIPAALLHVETSGATITYTNPSGAVEELVKATLAPAYLAPLEAAWSDLVPSTQSVRFDLADLARADFAARAAIYAQLIPQGVMTADEARSREGWGPVEGEATAPSPSPSPFMQVPA